MTRVDATSEPSGLPAAPAAGQRARRWPGFIYGPLVLGCLLLAGGLVTLGWMAAWRREWNRDSTIAAADRMWSQLINGSTIGVVLLIAGGMLVIAGLLFRYLKMIHEDIHTAFSTNGFTTYLAIRDALKQERDQDE